MELHKCRRLVTVACLLPLLLTGCWDRREVNDLAFVIGNAFDKSGDEYEESVQFPLPNMLGGSTGGGGGGGGSQDPWMVMSGKGRTIKEASIQIQHSMSRELNFSHRRVLLLGEELARDRITPVMDIITRMPQNRLTSLIMVTEGPAKPILQTKTKMENLPSEIVRETVTRAMKEPLTATTLLNKLLERGVDVMIPVVGIQEMNEEPTITATGVGIFRKDKLVEIVKDEVARGLLLASNDADRTTVTIEAEDGEPISIQIQESRSDKLIHYSGAHPKVTLKIRMIGFAAENQSAISMNRTETVHQIERKVSEKVESMVTNAIEKIQEARSDVLGIGQQIYKERPGTWKQIEQEWDQMYPTVEITPDVQFQMEHSGSLIRSLERVDVDD